MKIFGSEHNEHFFIFPVLLLPSAFSDSKSRNQGLFHPETENKHGSLLDEYLLE